MSEKDKYQDALDKAMLKIATLAGDNQALSELNADLRRQLGQLQEEIARNKADIANAERQAKEAVPDYPWQQQGWPASQVAYVLCATLEGTNAANNDLHDKIKEFEGLLRPLVTAMCKWGNEEDGIPEDFYDDWRKAKDALKNTIKT